MKRCQLAGPPVNPNGSIFYLNALNREANVIKFSELAAILSLWNIWQMSIFVKTFAFFNWARVSLINGME